MNVFFIFILFFTFNVILMLKERKIKKGEDLRKRNRERERIAIERNKQQSKIERGWLLLYVSMHSLRQPKRWKWRRRANVGRAHMSKGRPCTLTHKNRKKGWAQLSLNLHIWLGLVGRILENGFYFPFSRNSRRQLPFERERNRHSIQTVGKPFREVNHPPPSPQTVFSSLNIFF